jgi:F420-0:gamma-glutamyl ligase
LAIASKIITLGGGNLSDISISKSTAHRQRKRKREEAVKEIFNDWMKNKPPFLVVRQSKLIVKQKGQSNERLFQKEYQLLLVKNHI